MKVTDFGDFFSAIGLGDATPRASRVDYEIVWTPAAATQHVRDADFGFVGDYVPATTQITFTAQNDHGDVVFRSNPGGQSNPGPAAVGSERNGVFFH